MFLPESGTKQGCPLSPSLFIIAIDPLLRLLHGIKADRDDIGAFADDVDMAIHNFKLSLPSILAAFSILVWFVPQ